jgi:hypothetical protein
VLDAWAPLTVAAVTFMDAADTNADRRLSDPEIATAIKRLLATANLPADSSVDRSNAVAVIDKLIPDDLRRRVPAKLWTDWLFTSSDANKDDRLSAEEMLATYRRFQSGSDADRDGLMDNRDLIEALSAAGAPRDPDPAR